MCAQAHRELGAAAWLLCDPAPTRLPLAKLGAEFASGIRLQEIARVEKVVSRRPAEERWQLSDELITLGTSRPPQTTVRRYLPEAEHLLHSAVAVRSDNEVLTRKFLRGSLKPEDRIMVKLTLLPVINNGELTPANT